MDNEKLMNEFGNAMHEVWSHWMKHLFTQGWYNPDGTFRIKRDRVEQWKRQMNTQFSKLSEEEQNTDIKVFQDFFGKQIVNFSEELAGATADKIIDKLKGRINE